MSSGNLTKDNIDYDVMWKDFCGKKDYGPKDHIQANIQLSSKINKTRDIQHSSYNNSQKQIKKFKDENDIVKRFTRLQKLNKWKEFKSKK